MKRFCTFIAVILGLVMPTHAMAGTPYTINWDMIAENPQCEAAHLFQNGGAYFHVNDAPIPTYEVPGAFVEHANGWQSNQAQAGFDSVLLRMGNNDFRFGVGNFNPDNSCVHATEVVTLVSPPLGIEKLLFNVRRDGVAFNGTSNLDLTLEEINPQLAKDIAILEAEIADERKWLVANASQIADLDAKLDALQALETELDDLLTRSLDEITVEDLDEILKRYSSVVDEATREALKQVLADLKKSLDDLQAELASLMANFGDQANAVADLLTGDARQNGFGPDDPSNYALGPGDVPWVEVPDISNVPGAFDPANDPYAAYADDVIASLDANVSGNQVIGRATFIATVRAWRTNQAALQKAILARMSVSQAETNAFLNAQNKVTSYLQKFVDASGWFLDAPIPLDVRADVDGPLKNLYGVLAEDLKDRLNAWDAKWNPPEANLFFDTLRAFSAGMQAGEEIAQEYRETMRSIVHGASRVAIGFVPFVGTGMDLCEAVTGKEWCMPSGRELTTGERIFSGIGFGVGKLVKVWKGVGSAAISGEGKLAAAGIVGLGEEVVEALAKARIAQWKTLTRGAITATEKLTNEFEKKVVLALIKKEQHKVLAMGEGVENILRTEADVGADLMKSADFLTVSPKGGLIVTEAKYPSKVVWKPGVNCDTAIEQLETSMKQLVKKGDAQDVELVQLAIPKGAALAVGKLDGTAIYYTIKDGYLLKNGQRIPMPGKPDFFVKVLELD